MTSLLLSAVLTAAVPPALTCAELKPPEIEMLAGKDVKVSLQMKPASLDRVLSALGAGAGFRASYQGYTPIVSLDLPAAPLADALSDLSARYGLLNRAPAPDLLVVRGFAAPNMGGVSVPVGKDRPNPNAVPGASGKVMLYAVICEDGTVGAVADATGRGEPRLVEEAIAAVRRWTYEPAQKDGKPVAVSMMLTVDFRPN